MVSKGFVYGKFLSSESAPAGHFLEEIPISASDRANMRPPAQAIRQREAGHRLFCLRHEDKVLARFWLGFGGICTSGGRERLLPEGLPYAYDIAIEGGRPDSIFSKNLLNPLLLCLQDHLSEESKGRLVLCTPAELQEKEAKSSGLYLVATYSSLAPRLSCVPLTLAQGIPEKALHALRRRLPAFTALAARALFASALRKYLIEGKLGGKPLRIAFNGPKEMARYYSGVIFSHAPSKITPLFFGIPSGAIDMDVQWFARAAGTKPRGTILPSFCRSIMNPKGAFDDYLKSLPQSALSDIRKIKAGGFKPVVSREFVDFLIFYHSMYLPMVGARHREHSLHLSFDELENFFNHGFIQFVMRGQCPIVGMITVEHGNVLWGKVMGVAAGSFMHTQAGANSAAIYFLIKYAFERRLGMVDLGYSSPFASDGVQKFKAKWGTRIVADRNIDFLCLDFRDEETKRRFFSALSPLELESLEPYDPPSLSSSV